MFAITNFNRHETLYFNKKENAVKKAIEIFTENVFEEVDSIKEWNEDFMGEENAFENTVKEIETGKYFDDNFEIFEIETED